MDPFTRIDSLLVAIDQINVDTDQIIPARFLSKSRESQVEGLFFDIRRDTSGSLRMDFPLNDPKYQHARILVAGENFGCGSSREQAVTVLLDNGFRAVIAPSFSDIFYGNCFQNGVLPIRLAPAQVKQLKDLSISDPEEIATISLPEQVVSVGTTFKAAFEIDSFRKECLVKGLDEVTLTRGYEDHIRAFERQQDRQMPWLNLPRPAAL
ncbi:3-isopropylmalate dehydratase small subunit [Caballeronia sp. LP003]|uniref:3-isopropylmalate dehydratase small subunit n=1 Tax=Caballeronia sp. LP003 TaxID=3038551 RepID=UPI0028665485|nr:3-isopropylmalate dehydratase small subunit [Caballeronia sp. LP003]MDR5785269.1 3-isopropylmalate dehydratase small subunit [Caballeronia sp. LP003]